MQTHPASEKFNRAVHREKPVFGAMRGRRASVKRLGGKVQKADAGATSRKSREVWRFRKVVTISE
jgi:hypothetical protein